MFPHFEYDIIVLEANAPSDYQYAARVGYILRHSGVNPEVVPWHEHQIPETWGLTQEDAYNKLEHAVKRWIATQEQ